MHAATTQAKILIADDRVDICKALRTLLKSHGYGVDAVRQPNDILPRLESETFDLLLLDLNYTRDITSGKEGLDVLSKLRERMPELPVIVMTAFASVKLAVATLQRGANDFLEKPWDNQRLLTMVKTQLELGRALDQVGRLKARNRLLEEKGRIDLIANAPSMRPVLELLNRVAPTDANVLITGEHGTGKSVLAQVLHQRSQRADQALVTVNVGAVSDALFESELFGHVKGAFTDARETREGRFQLADGGTLFLDEIGNLSLAAQAKLLRVLETGEFEPVGSSRTLKTNVRVISATNAELPSLVQRGTYREDLLFRLNTIELKLPSLRDREEDILPLSQYFLTRHASRYGKGVHRLDQTAQALLLAHTWPGNVRELDHVLLRGVLMAPEDVIRADDLGLVPNTSRPSLDDWSLDEMERMMMEKALKRCQGNIKEASALLGLSRGAFYRRLEKHGIDRERFL